MSSDIRQRMHFQWIEYAVFIEPQYMQTVYCGCTIYLMCRNKKKLRIIVNVKNAGVTHTHIHGDRSVDQSDNV